MNRYYADPAKLYAEALSSMQESEIVEYNKRDLVVSECLPSDSKLAQKVILLFGWLNDLARRYKDSHHYEQSLRVLKIMLKLCPSNPITHHNLAVIYLRLDEVELAEQYVLRAHQLAPDNDKYTDLLLLTKSIQEKYTEILDYSVELINKHPLKAVFRTWHGYALQMLKRNDEAIEVLKCAIVLDKKDTTPRVILAGAYKEVGKLTEAIEVCMEAHKIKPEEVGILDMLGCAYGMVGDYCAAGMAYAKALKLDPFSEYSAKGLLLALKKQGKLSDELYKGYRNNIQTFCQLYAMEDSHKEHKDNGH